MAGSALGGVAPAALRAAYIPVLIIAMLFAELASAQTISNGDDQAGTLLVGATDSYTLTASLGDNIVLRLGSVGFAGNLKLYGPDGALLKTSGGNSSDWEIAYTATNSGTFSVSVSSYYAGQGGTYVLHLAEFPESFTVPAGDEGGPMVNGGNYAGTNSLGDLDMWSFTANAGDNIVLRLGSVGFQGNLRLYGPDGALLKTSGGNSTDWEIAYTATNSGTFTALVSSYYLGGIGTYVLHLAEFPEAFTVPAGDEGGPMVSGGNYAGTNSLGDLDMWSFTANAGDNIVLRLGSVGFQGNLRLYGPDGALLKTSGGNSTDWEIAYTATNGGTFTALVSSYYAAGAGTYVLHLAEFPEPFTVPAGDEGGPMVSGGDYSGTTSLGDLDLWSFTANAGDNIVLRLGSTGFGGNLRLYGPDGALLKTSGGNSTDWEITYTATNSGTFTALVSSYYPAEVGTYVLRLAEFPEAFIVPAGDEGGPMVNGGNYAGTNGLGDLDLWSFTANAGDNIVLRLGSAGFQGNLRLYGPDGALLKTSGGNGTDWEIALTATNSGTFTALVSSYFAAGVGTYVLHLAEFPEAFTVPAGDEGGLMINGGSYAGMNSLGDLDMWSFTANAGDNIVLRVGSVGFQGNLRLYGPDGALLKTSGGDSTDWEMTYTATNSGTFTVLVSSYYLAGVGTYVLRLAEFPESFIVPPGEAGGLMTNGITYTGSNSLGGLTMWAFTACVGDSINLVAYPTNFTAQLNLYGPQGDLLRTSASGTAAAINYIATNCGTHTVLLSSYYQAGVGTYTLTGRGLSYGLRVCPPIIAGATLTVNGVGGITNAGFILYSATNVTTKFDLWSPVFTNQFDQFGVFAYTNGYNPAQKQMYFRFIEQAP